MITIGNQTSFAAATPTEPFDYALANGFDAFEWFPDKHGTAGWDPDDLGAPLREQIRETALAAGMRLSVHSRLEANPLLPDCQGRLREDLALARDLGAALLNIHLFDEAGVPAFIQAILPLVRQASEAGLAVTVENTPSHAPELFNALFERIRREASPFASHIGMCLDVGHANLCAATRNDYLGFLDRLDMQVPILHLHLHENWGDADSHLVLFTGPSAADESGVRGLIKRLRVRNYSGSIILEQWPQPPSLLSTARDRLRQMLPSEEERASSGGSTARPPSTPGTRHSSLPPPPSVPSPGPDPGDFTDALVAADRRCRSWREKLDWVRERLARETGPLTQEQLVDVAAYLRFLGTGEISCAEDGRHFRPAHHSRIAMQIEDRLARLSSPAEVFIARKIYPWLPSAAQPFRRAEPLTRIRDIAHRNDIPQDLKREIKHTLQNKLHRCAGPEDLATATAILERITAPGANYSAAFVEQFKTFHEELREFFNARSLDERLNALLPKVSGREADLIRFFTSQKAGAGLPEQASALRALTDLRRHCLAAAETRPSPERQEFLLADIGLEDFAFVLLSRMANEFDGQSGAGDSSRPPSAGAAWEPLLETVLLATANAALSSVEPEESTAVESELEAWRQGFRPADREQLLRLKATAGRIVRLTEEHCQRILSLFLPRVGKLGRALGVAEHSIRVFCEAETRGHLIFQLSRLGAEMLRRLRSELASPPWDVLVSGQTVGRVRAIGTLGELGEALPEAVMAVLGSAEGDEEIPKGVAGIVLAHEMPHLSHLGVRARQAGVVFVVCEDKAAFDELRSLDGQVISLTAFPDKVHWAPARGPAPARVETRQARLLPARLVSEPACISLEQVEAECCGGKAAGARRLAALARRAGAGFNTPRSWVVPFGVMDEGLRAAPHLEAEYRRLRGEINRMPAGEFATATQRLRELIRRVPVPAEIAATVRRHFDRDRLMVRSSANCEDLAELAGAGLYDSIAGVAPEDIAAAVRAVWSSLWTTRAALSRKQARIPHDQALMAVLIQQMLAPDVSFVLHTVNPLDGNRREVYAEAAAGLGETLASGAVRGSPYRFVCDKESGTLRMLSFANFSQALRPGADGGVSRQTVDYSRIPLSRDPEARKELGGRLARIGRQVEEALGGPQDIEGAVVEREIYLVQARPQQGLK
jgi:phosphoglucan,water dikinase